MRRNNVLPMILTTGILGILLGALLVFVDFAKVIDVLFIIIGIIILICNLPAFIFSLTSGNKAGLISTLFPIAAAILMIFWHQSLLFYILGIYLLILPLQVLMYLLQEQVCFVGQVLLQILLVRLRHVLL